MRCDVGDLPMGQTVPFMFPAYDSNGGSVTITGLAVTDIEIYKGTSMTQRASDNGYALIDTDGIDLDGRVGIHGFSVDFSDNSDAGFYAAGDFYHAIVDAITVDSQTVRFVFAFSLGFTLRPSTAGNTIGVESDGDLTKVNTLNGHTAQTGDSYARIGANGASLSAIPWNSAWDAEVQSEVADGLAAYDTPKEDTLLGYFQLLARSDAAIASDRSTELAAINANEGSGAGTYDNAQESQQYIGFLCGLTYPVVAANQLHLTDIKGTAFVKDTHSLTNILFDTTVLQQEWADGGRLDNLLDACATATALATAQADLDILTGSDGATLATSQPNYAPATPAQVNAQMLDVMQTDTHAEIGQETPAEVVSYDYMLRWAYKTAKNKIDNDGTENKLYDHAGTTVDQKQATTESGGTLTSGRWLTGA